ncbi:MAG: hypothetical protein RIC55_22590 [Pirellulaceae bacterium]
MRDADLSLLTAAEIAVVTELLEQFAGKDAVEMNLPAHPLDGWRLARVGETIPYGIAKLQLADETSADKQIDDDLRAKLTTLQASA